MNKHVKIYYPIFDFTFHIFTGEGKAFVTGIKKLQKDILTYCPYMDAPDYFKNRGGMSITLGKSGYIWIEDAANLNHIVHEAHHAVTDMFLAFSEIKNDSDSMEEVLAYHNGWLVSEIVDKLKAKKRKK